jgi:hypothetical protein
MHRRALQASSQLRLRTLVGRSAVGLLTAVALMAFAQAPQQQSTPNPDKPYLLPEANRLPGPIDQLQMQQQQSNTAKIEAANAVRRKQISDDAAKLLELATELKTAVDKTDKDTLSLDVIRKADTIERLAKGVKEKMKLTVGAS